MQSMQPKLIVHGGAWNIPDAYHADHLAGVRRAAEVVYPQLLAGVSALDAVEAAVRVLEDDPTFDAGRGAFLNEAGEIELDAIIIDGQSLEFGAVAALQNVLHPVSVARRVLDRTEHCLLVGAGALAFARAVGFEELPPEALLTARELDFYRQLRNDPHFRTHHPFREGPGDTVGAVALDRAGNIAAATSTGGTARKLRGRVGDCPIIGAGAFADNELGAVSATGWGESIMKVLLSKTVADAFATHPAMAAAQKGIDLLARKVNGLGGVIGINAAGEYAYANNTPYMAMALAEVDGRIRVSI